MINKGGDCNKDVIPNKKRDGKEDVNEREDGEKNIVIGKGHEGKQYDKVATEGVATDEAGDGIQDDLTRQCDAFVPNIT